MQRNPIRDLLDQVVFNALYRRALVYNTCWEDPAVDHQALELDAHDELLVITSAGCNVLDYALAGPRRIHAVDANPRQTALLELKIAGIRELDYEDFFLLFGRGRHPRFDALYRDGLRHRLSTPSRAFWDSHCHWFAEGGGGFYSRGLSGLVGRAFRAYLSARPRLRRAVLGLFEASSLESQRALYEESVAPLLWGKALNWALSRQTTLSLLGVPHAQRKEVQAQHAGGVAGFVRDSLEFLAHHLPFRDNYFYALYVQGEYRAGCCPEYLKPPQFERLKAGLVDVIDPRTCTVTEFLKAHQRPLSCFVLLDHMDWMSANQPAALAEEWDSILGRATRTARIIFRSAHAAPAYLANVKLANHDRLLDRLLFDRVRAEALTRQDRVHTYAGFHIASLKV